jgi:hypothetical protein
LRAKPAKKKPGWKEAEAEYAAWLARAKSTTLFKTKPDTVKIKGPKLPMRCPVVEESRVHRQPSLVSTGAGGTKPVHRPDIVYKDDPEMLARELKARERKFATAPAYNKGNSVLITDEMMKDITAGKTRRR